MKTKSFSSIDQNLIFGIQGSESIFCGNVLAFGLWTPWRTNIVWLSNIFAFIDDVMKLFCTSIRRIWYWNMGLGISGIWNTIDVSWNWKELGIYDLKYESAMNIGLISRQRQDLN